MCFDRNIIMHNLTADETSIPSTPLYPLYSERYGSEKKKAAETQDGGVVDSEQSSSSLLTNNAHYSVTPRRHAANEADHDISAQSLGNRSLDSFLRAELECQMLSPDDELPSKADGQSQTTLPTYYPNYPTTRQHSMATSVDSYYTATDLSTDMNYGNYKEETHIMPLNDTKLPDGASPAVTLTKIERGIADGGLLVPNNTSLAMWNGASSTTRVVDLPSHSSRIDTATFIASNECYPNGQESQWLQKKSDAKLSNPFKAFETGSQQSGTGSVEATPLKNKEAAHKELAIQFNATSINSALALQSPIGNVSAYVPIKDLDADLSPQHYLFRDNANNALASQGLLKKSNIQTSNPFNNSEKCAQESGKRCTEGAPLKTKEVESKELNIHFNASPIKFPLALQSSNLTAVVPKNELECGLPPKLSKPFMSGKTDQNELESQGQSEKSNVEHSNPFIVSETSSLQSGMESSEATLLERKEVAGEDVNLHFNTNILKSPLTQQSPFKNVVPKNEVELDVSPKTPNRLMFVDAEDDLEMFNVSSNPFRASETRSPQSGEVSTEATLLKRSEAARKELDINLNANTFNSVQPQLLKTDTCPALVPKKHLGSEILTETPKPIFSEENAPNAFESKMQLKTSNMSSNPFKETNLLQSRKGSIETSAFREEDAPEEIEIVCEIQKNAHRYDSTPAQLLSVGHMSDMVSKKEPDSGLQCNSPLHLEAPSFCEELMDSKCPGGNISTENPCNKATGNSACDSASALTQTVQPIRSFYKESERDPKLPESFPSVNSISQETKSDACNAAKTLQNTTVNSENGNGTVIAVLSEQLSGNFTNDSTQRETKENGIGCSSVVHNVTPKKLKAIPIQESVTGILLSENTAERTVGKPTYISSATKTSATKNVHSNASSPFIKSTQQSEKVKTNASPSKVVGRNRYPILQSTVTNTSLKCKTNVCSSTKLSFKLSSNSTPEPTKVEPAKGKLRTPMKLLSRSVQKENKTSSVNAHSRLASSLKKPSLIKPAKFITPSDLFGPPLTQKMSKCSATPGNRSGLPIPITPSISITSPAQSPRSEVKPKAKALTPQVDTKQTTKPPIVSSPKTKLYTGIQSPVRAYIHTSMFPLMTNVKAKTPDRTDFYKSEQTTKEMWSKYTCGEESKSYKHHVGDGGKGIENIDVNNVPMLLPAVRCQSASAVLRKTVSEESKLPRLNTKFAKMLEQPKTCVIKHVGHMNQVSEQEKSQVLNRPVAMSSRQSELGDKSYAVLPTSGEGDISVYLAKSASMFK